MQDNLRPPSQQVSARAPYLWAVEAALGQLFLVAVALGATAFGWISVPWWGWVVVAVVFVGYLIVMPPFRFRVHRWEVTGTAVYTQEGWLARARRVAPMARVQTVDFEQGALARVFGLATVTVTTASAAGPLKIQALDEPLALQLVDDLTRQAGSGDAT